MLSILQNLGSKEAALKFNRRVYGVLGENRGCIDSLACEHCFHVISDSLCLCGGFSECPNCHYKTMPKVRKYSEVPEEEWKNIPFGSEVSNKEILDVLSIAIRQWRFLSEKYDKGNIFTDKDDDSVLFRSCYDVYLKMGGNGTKI